MAMSARKGQGDGEKPHVLAGPPSVSPHTPSASIRQDSAVLLCGHWGGQSSANPALASIL